MKTLKKAFIVALCAALLLLSAVPSFALTGTVYQTINKPLLNVRAVCSGHVNSSDARARISMSFINTKDHLPESDYRCRVSMELSGPDEYHLYTPLEGNMSCQTNLVNTSTFNLSLGEYSYWIFDNEVYFDYIQ